MRVVRVMLVITLLLVLLPTVFVQANTRPMVVEEGLWTKLQQGERVPTLIILNQQADTSFAQNLPTKEQKNAAVVKALRDQALRDQPPVLDLLAQHGIKGEAFLSLNAVAADLDLASMQALSQLPNIDRIIDDTPQQRQTPLQPEVTSPNSPTAIEWGLNNIQAPAVWNLGYRGQGIVVAGEDTGVRWTHAAIKAKYRGWSRLTVNHDYNWYDGVRSTVHSSSCGSASPVPCDDNGHGTHTVGTMLGDDGGVNQIGVAPDAQWIACRNMDAGFGTIAIYVRCIDWMLAPYPVNGTPTQGDPAKAPDVINNSWGCVGPPDEDCDANHLGDIQPSVQNVTNAGIMFVVSAGNDGSACQTILNPPALYPESYTVGAYSSSNTIASFSSRGPIVYNGTTRIGPDISAPGVSVRSAYSSSDTTYSSLSGTSMAGPHVAGAVALLWSARPELRGQLGLTRKILNETAIPTTSSQTCGGIPGTNIPNNTFGNGRLNIYNAVQPTLKGTVTLDGQPTNATLTIQSPAMQWNISGAYTTTLPSGTYQLTAQVGTQTQTVTITIVKGQITTQNFAFTTPVGVGDVLIRNFVFTPQTITITVGMSVTWQNLDPTPHTVTSDTGIWDSGSLGQNQTFTQNFPTVGTFPYHCELHPSMKGKVVVLPDYRYKVYIPLVTQ